MDLSACPPKAQVEAEPGISPGEGDRGTVLTGEQVDMLVETLLSNSQARKGRRAWLIKMLGRSPKDGEVPSRLAECRDSQAGIARDSGGESESLQAVEAEGDDGLQEMGRDIDSSMLQDALEQEKIREREMIVLRRIGLVGCGEIAQVSTKPE